MRVRARERRLPQRRAVAAVVNRDLHAFLADLARHDHRQRQLLGDLRETVLRLEQSAGVRETELHLARLRELIAVGLEHLHHLLADDDLLGPVELRHAGAFPARAQGVPCRRGERDRKRQRCCWDLHGETIVVIRIPFLHIRSGRATALALSSGAPRRTHLYIGNIVNKMPPPRQMNPS